MIQTFEALGLVSVGMFTKDPHNMTIGHHLLSLIKAVGKRMRKMLPETRKSNPISKLFRPVFEMPAIKSLVGTQLAIVTLLTGMFSSIPVSALGVVSSDVVSLEKRIEVQVKTDSSLTYPAPEAIGVSQGYHVFHPGIDIRAPKGTAVKPIAGGIVTVVAVESYGWGHRIEIDHGGEVKSLYAHLGKMYVEEGDVVTVDTTIAEIGMTGHTTGPHLHLEVEEDGRKVNPAKYLIEK